MAKGTMMCKCLHPYFISASGKRIHKNSREHSKVCDCHKVVRGGFFEKMRYHQIEAEKAEMKWKKELSGCTRPEPAKEG